jgi:hypothetical protein
MKPALRTFLFWLPLAAVFGPPALVLWLGGEFIPARGVVERLSARDRLVLHGAAYTNSAIYVKMRMIAARAPQVLALGTSRVMQFRSGFFRRDAGFYNAGGIIARLMHFRAVLDRIPREHQPEVLLIATDAYFFNPRFDKLDRDELGVDWLTAQMTARPDGTEIFLTNWRKVWGDLADGKVEARKLAGLRGLRDRIGLNAVCRGQGFRNDGSYLYAEAARDITQPGHRDYQFSESLGRIAAGKGRFVYGREIPPAALQELEALLDSCAERGVEVVGFLPPYAHTVWSAMEERGDDYAYLWKLPAVLRSAFKRRNFEFYDFSDLAWLGGDDSEAIDGFHGSEKTYLRALIAMLRAGSRLNHYADLSTLETTLAAARGDTGIAPDHF